MFNASTSGVELGQLGSGIVIHISADNSSGTMSYRSLHYRDWFCCIARLQPQAHSHTATGILIEGRSL